MGDVEIRLRDISAGQTGGIPENISAGQTRGIPENISAGQNAGIPENIGAGQNAVIPENEPGNTGSETDAGRPQDDVPYNMPKDIPDDVPDEETLVAAMEAILFAMGEAVPIDSIAQALGVSRELAIKASDTLAERCRRKGSGVSLNWYEDSLQLSTKPELYEYLIRIASEPKKPKLTPTLLETLSIIAFRQPVTRMEVENIRGVNSDFAINRLISFDLVKEVGRKEVPGRPLLFGTTQQFLRSFGIRSVEELPEPDSSRMETFREEAEEEISARLDI